MKRNLLKICVLFSSLLITAETYASNDCGCDMEHQSIELEAQVYADADSQKASLTEFSEKIRMEIQEATALLVEAGSP